MKKRFYILLLAILTISLSCNLLPTSSEPPEEDGAPPKTQPTTIPTAPPTLKPIPVTPPAEGPSEPLGASAITQVWANDGGDKVTQDELRATHDPGAIINSIWNGGEISLFGARNEVISFNLVLEAPQAQASGVEVSISALTGPNGSSIDARPTSGEDLFTYVGRNIELFYVRYLEIRGLSVDLAYDGYDERHIPERCRGPYDPEDGSGSGTWEDRPCHNKYYPDIAVPLEVHTPFAIQAGANQSIWGDIYIPKGTPAGEYTGMLTIKENGAVTWEIPIKLQVRNFSLPDLPSARTMLAYSLDSANDRYFGDQYPTEGSEDYQRSLTLADRHFQLAHRHKISLIDAGDIPTERMEEYWVDRLNGELFTPERGYDGPGVGVGNNVYSIGTYSSWWWKGDGKEGMWENTDLWVEWFEAQSFDTPTEYFLYLIDESEKFKQTEKWAKWMDDNPGPGQRLMSLATILLPDAFENVPSLDIPTGAVFVSANAPSQNAADAFKADPDKRLYMYNGHRPVSGSFAIEDDGIALRELAWGQYKIQANRWFYWDSTYYINFQCNGYDDPRAITNLFQRAQVYGCYDEDNESLGESGWNYFNGDGVLFYPGSDVHYPEENYGLLGPFASLRLKHWRRGIQDVDYLTLAAQIDPARTAEIVQAMVPKILWEVGVEDPDDPTWVLTDISWPTDPDVWEAARAKLADIIEAANQ